MATLEEALRLARTGCFTEALAELDGAKVLGAQRHVALVLIADLLTYVGSLAEARTLAHRLLGGERRLSMTERSTCEGVLGRVARENTSSQVAIDHLQHSVSLAITAKDLAAALRSRRSNAR